MREDRKPTRACEAPGCRAITRSGKPYCSDHVEQNPYVSGLLERIEARERRAVGTQTAERVIALVRKERIMSRERLAEQSHLTVRQIEQVVVVLVRTGKVRVAYTDRGRMMVVLED